MESQRCSLRFGNRAFFDSCMSDRSHQTPLPYTQNRNKKKKKGRKRPLCSLRSFRPSRTLLATLALLHNKRQTTHEKHVFFFFSPWLRQAFFDNLAVMMASGRIPPAHLMNGCLSSARSTPVHTTTAGRVLPLSFSALPLHRVVSCQGIHAGPRNGRTYCVQRQPCAYFYWKLTVNDSRSFGLAHIIPIQFIILQARNDMILLR